MPGKTILITTSSFDVAGNPNFSPLTRAGFEIVVNPYGRRLTAEDAIGLLRKYAPVGMIAGVEPLNADVLAAATDLKVLARCGAGLDNVDMQAAQAANIKVSNTPDAPTVPVAELTMGLILSLIRGVARADRAVHEGRWVQVKGALLNGKVLGVVGYGRIGRRVAMLAHAFGAKVLAYDQIAGADDGTVHRVDVDTLLELSDIVTLHVPFGPETRHMINKETIAHMKPGAFLVNASRGGIVDEAALHDALEQGHLAGAALDVYEDEPYNGPLAQCETALLTCHMGGAAREARTIMEAEAAHNLVRDLAASGLL